MLAVRDGCVSCVDSAGSLHIAGLKWGFLAGTSLGCLKREGVVMGNTKLKYPALYQSADIGSNLAQKQFLRIIKLEYFLLFLISGLVSTRSLTAISPSIISILLAVLVMLFIYKVVKKKDQDWYRCRALAESIKTLTWRFTMRSHPFDDAKSIDAPISRFREQLHSTLKANEHIARNLIVTDEPHITDSMIALRRQSLEERISHYAKFRIDEQRTWYSKKSKHNKNAIQLWSIMIVAVYILAFLSLYAVEMGTRHLFLIFDPLIIIATSGIGWMQMKRHGELIASYNLAAHEIGIIGDRSDAVDSEERFSEFVNEAELAFSREHTQWVARRDIT